MGRRQGTSDRYSEIPKLENFLFSEKTGFVLENPLLELPEYFSEWERIARKARVLFHAKTLRSEVDKMPLLDHTRLSGYLEMRCAHTRLIFLLQCYVWQEGLVGAPDAIPKQLAIPLCGVSNVTGLPPQMIIASTMQANYRLKDPEGPLEAENITQVIKLPIEEGQGDWWLGCSFECDVASIDGVKAIVEAMKGVVDDDRNKVKASLQRMAKSIAAVGQGVAKFNKTGMLKADDVFKDILVFSDGWGYQEYFVQKKIVYEGVTREPKQALRKNVAMIPGSQCFDSALGISFGPGADYYMQRLRDTMAPEHAELIRVIKTGPSIKTYVSASDDTELKEAFNACIEEQAKFRSGHIGIVAKFLITPAGRVNTDVTDGREKVDTGAKMAMAMLKGWRDKTQAYKLSV